MSKLFTLAGLLVAALAAGPALAAEPLQRARLDQNLGARVPLALAFRDEAGRVVSLGDYFGRGPVVLTFAYFGCSQLCTEVLSSAKRALAALPPGTRYTALTVSIDPDDSPGGAAMRRRMLLGSGPQPDWHFLTGGKGAIRALTAASGFHYAYDRTTHQFAHPAGLMVLTPQGRLSRYFYGLEVPAPALAAALADASGERVGERVHEVLIRCFHDVFSSGRHGPWIDAALKAACALTVALVAGFVGLALRGERRRARQGG